MKAAIAVPAVRLATIGLLALAAGCMDDRPMTAPAVNVRAPAQAGCTVTTRIGRTAYTVDPALCSRPGANLDYYPPYMYRSDYFGLVTNNTFDRPFFYDKLQDLGTTVVRLPFSWRNAQSFDPSNPLGNDQYWNEAYFDKIRAEVDALWARGIEVLLNIDETPPYAQGCLEMDTYRYPDMSYCPYEPKGPPDANHPNTWGYLVTKVAYELANAPSPHHRVKYFSYGNEPNAMFWRGGANPPTYSQRITKFAEMINVLASMVHQFGGVVVAPDLADGEVDGHHEHEWLIEFLGQAGTQTDIVSVHVYKGVSWWDRNVMGRDRAYGVMREAWDINNLPVMANRTFWITEAGAGPSNAGDTEGGQATFVRDFMTNLVSNQIPRLGKVMQFKAWTDITEGEYYFGLFLTHKVSGEHVFLQNRKAYKCFQNFSIYKRIPAHADDCWEVNTPPPPTPYVYISGPGEVADEASNMWTVNHSQGATLQTCNWWVDGQSAQVGGCAFNQSFDDGPSSHIISAIATLADGTDIPAADHPVSVYNGGCPTCNERKTGRRPLETPTSPSKGKPNRLVSRLMGLGR